MRGSGRRDALWVEFDATGSGRTQPRAEIIGPGYRHVWKRLRNRWWRVNIEDGPRYRTMIYPVSRHRTRAGARRMAQRVEREMRRPPWSR